MLQIKDFFNESIQIFIEIFYKYIMYIEISLTLLWDLSNDYIDQVWICVEIIGYLVQICMYVSQTSIFKQPINHCINKT